MANTGAAKGELCSFCRNPMNEGAFACGSCRADRRMVTSRWWLPFLLIPVFVGAMSLTMIGVLGLLAGLYQLSAARDSGGRDVVLLTAAMSISGVVGVLIVAITWVKRRKTAIYVKST